MEPQITADIESVIWLYSDTLKKVICWQGGVGGDDILGDMGYQEMVIKS